MFLQDHCKLYYCIQSLIYKLFDDRNTLRTTEPHCKKMLLKVPASQILKQDRKSVKTAYGLHFAPVYSSGSSTLHANIEGSGKTVRMRRLIWLFAFCIWHKHFLPVPDQLLPKPVTILHCQERKQSH